MSYFSTKKRMGLAPIEWGVACPAGVSDDARHSSRTMALSLWDGLFFSLMVGLGETYLSAFCLELNMTAVGAGLVTVLPVTLAAVFQLFAPYGVQAIGSRRRWVVACAVVQAMALVSLAGAALGLVGSGLGVYGAVLLYWTAALSAGPAWNAWIVQFVPEASRVHFFTTRARVSHVAVCLGMVIGGLSLHYGGEGVGGKLGIFSILFGLAAVFRIISAGLLFLQPSDPRPRAPGTLGSSPSVLGWALAPENRAVTLYLFALGFAVYVASPFFGPYMLRQLHMEYHVYLSVLAAAFLARVVTYPLMEAWINRRSTTPVLVSGAIVIMVVPSLWTVSDDLGYLLAVQMLGGIGWGAYELAVTLMLVRRYDEGHRTCVLSVTHLMNSLGMMVGALVGVVILGGVEPSYGDYHRIFEISTFLRCLPLALLPAFLNARLPGRLGAG